MDLSSFQFIENNIFSETESTVLEFKMITPEAPKRKDQQQQIRKKFWNYCKEYAVAFLNANVSGDLLVGILDEKNKPHYIKGIKLEDSFKDELDRNTNSKLTEIKPKVPVSCFSLHFHPLLISNGKRYEEHYVIQFSVKPIKEQDCLYTTNSGRCWIRRGTENVTLSDEDGSFRAEFKKENLRVLNNKLEENYEKLEKEPDSPKLILERARLLGDYGESIESQKYYEEYIKLIPGNQTVRQEYASTFQLEDKDQLQKALNVLGIKEDDHKLITTVNSRLNDYMWCINTGVFLRKVKRYKDAIHFFNMALKINPKYRKAAYEKNKTYILLYKKNNFL